LNKEVLTYPTNHATKCLSQHGCRSFGQLQYLHWSVCANASSLCCSGRVADGGGAIVQSDGFAVAELGLGFVVVAGLILIGDVKNRIEVSCAKVAVGGKMAGNVRTLAHMRHKR
jgi:hypothetical protein